MLVETDKLRSSEVEVQDPKRFSFSNVYVCNFSYVFMAKMNLLY